MSLMLKLSTIAVTTIILNAEFNVTKFIKEDLIKNPQIKVENIELLGEKDLKNKPNWKAYMVLMKLNIKGRSDNYPETILVNEKETVAVATSSPGLFDYKSHKVLGKDIRPEINDKYYQDTHLIAGNKNAEHKLVIFSDPQCPFCIRNVPQIYKDVKANPDKFSLYYYHMPLKRIHPVSVTLTKVMEVLQKEGKIEDAMKMYNLKINPMENNETKILDEVKKQLNISINSTDINKPEIKEQIKKDMDMATRVMLRGTPTVYLDGKFDKELTSYKKFIK